MSITRFILVLSLTLVPIGVAAWMPVTQDADDEVINYSKSTPTDPISKLQQQINSGKVKLAWSSTHGYMPAVLKALDIPISSQGLVFSKTSFQRDLISPATPRAIYFNDHTYIGWCQGGSVVEVSTVDPQLGATFYVLPQEKAERPQFLRQNHECLQCHESGLTRRIPGHLMRSIYTEADGQPIFSTGGFTTNDQSAMVERFGGWYVTGKSGKLRHMGNLIIRNPAQAEHANLDLGANRSSLDSLLDARPYLTGTSDITALMILQHQVNIHNLITRANHQSRIALHYERALNVELNRPIDFRSDSTTSRIRSACEPLVQALFMSGEAPLGDQITGSSGFALDFTKRGPLDSRGRSLRELDLKHRLFRYPLSYIIYSEAFDALPKDAGQYVMRRMCEIVSGEDKSDKFQHLSATDRDNIRGILMDTKPTFAKAFREWSTVRKVVSTGANSTSIH